MKPAASAATTLSDRPLAIIAGGGSIPVHVARAAAREGRRVMIVGIAGEADEAISEFPHDWFGWGQLGHLKRVLAGHGTGDVVLVGNVKARPDFKSLKPDLGTARMLPMLVSLMANGDDTVLTGAVKLVESWGHTVIGAHEIADDLVATAGTLTGKSPRGNDLMDANRAMVAAHAIGAVDAGQAAVSVNGRIVALEAAEGTDGVLARVASLRQNGRLKWSGRAGVLGKRPKPQQDLRVDMPTIGPSTVAGVDAAGLAGIAVQAGGVMIVDREGTLRRAEAAGVFILAVDV